ncbi:hypothetical protein HDU98_010420 [Podochytrium sp. JEL0797]|nr:hypothetical protein HDU98_010420 [Podochytrium sp. JEL0797]
MSSAPGVNEDPLPQQPSTVTLEIAPPPQKVAVKATVVDKVPGDQVCVRLLLISGDKTDLLFVPTENIDSVKTRIFENWPEDWTAPETPETKNNLRVLLRGKFLDQSITLADAKFPLGQTTTCHLLIKNGVANADAPAPAGKAGTGGNGGATGGAAAQQDEKEKENASLKSHIKTQTAAIQFLQEQYRVMRGRVLQLVVEAEETQEMFKHYLKIIHNLRNRETKTKQETRLLNAFEAATIVMKDLIVEPFSSSSVKRGSISGCNPTFEFIEEPETESHADVTVIKDMDDQAPRSRRLSLADQYPHMGTLLKFPLFASFPLEVMQLVSDTSYEMRRKQGQILVHKGDEGAEIFFLIEGTVSVVVDEKSITDMQPNTFFGELGMLFKFKRTATVVAKTDCIVVVVTKQKLEEIITENPSIKSVVDDFAANKEAWWSRQQYVSSNQHFGAEFANEIAREEIKKLEMFSTAPDAFCDSLAMKVKCVVFHSGDNVVTLGDESDAIFFILKGAVEVVGPDGTINAEIGSGSFFGEVGVLLGMKRTASIRSKGESNLFKLSKKDLDEVVLEYPSMKATLKVAADERFELFKKRSAPATGDSKEEHVPDQFDMEVGSQSLAKLTLFKGVDKTVLSELAMQMIRKTWKPNDFIIQCNHLGTSMFFLAAGTAQVLSAFDELIDSVSGPSAFFGEVAIIEQVPRTASVKCTSTCSTYELKKEHFVEVIAKYPEISKQIKATADERMQNYLMRSVLA